MVALGGAVLGCGSSDSLDAFYLTEPSDAAPDSPVRAGDAGVTPAPSGGDALALQDAPSPTVDVVTVLPDGAPKPTLSITDVTVSEGNSGTVPAVFTVTLSAALLEAITVSYTTADGTATSSADYVAASGTLTFAAGVTSQTITVNVNGDTIAEATETFLVNLSSPSAAAVLGDAQGQAFVKDDDGATALPVLSIADYAANEGDTGTTQFAFVVTLSAAPTSPVTVDYDTADGTAVSAGAGMGTGRDYTATSGTLTFATGETQKTLTVSVLGDRSLEPDETFFVNLSSGASATIADPQAIGTIRNDD
jgi:hypothetical protein